MGGFCVLKQYYYVVRSDRNIVLCTHYINNLFMCLYKTHNGIPIDKKTLKIINNDNWASVHISSDINSLKLDFKRKFLSKKRSKICNSSI